MEKTQEKEVAKMYRIFGYNSRKESIEDIKKNLTKLEMDLNGKDYDLALSQTFCAVVSLLNNEGITTDSAVKKASSWLKKNQATYKKIGRRKRVAILPGSFDPITDGHISVGKEILSAGLADEILYMVANNHAEKENQTPAKRRLKMVQKALKDQRSMGASSFEIDNDLGGQTHYITKVLMKAKAFKDKELFLVLGADVANSYSKWPDATLQERLFPCIIVPRNGYELSFSAWYNSGIHVVMEHAETKAISSTMVRNAIKNEDYAAAQELIHIDVLDYIKKHKLYTNE